MAIRLRLGIAGFGRLAQDYYVPALRPLADQLTLSVADPLAPSRDAARRAFPHCRLFEDARAMLDGMALDAILVASPPSTHMSMWELADRQGLPVFMEKPFPLSDELDRVDPTYAGWSRLMVNYNRRFWGPYRRIARWIRDGDIGRPQWAQITLNINAAAWSRISNHRAEPRDGGVLEDLGSPVLDLVATTFGTDLREIGGERSAPAGPRERVALHLAYETGLTVDCDLAYGIHNQESFVARGADGLVQLADPNFLAWRYRGAPPLRPAWEIPANLGVLAWRALARDRSMLRCTIRHALLAFLEAVRDGRTMSPGIHDAMRVGTWLQAARRAIATGVPDRPAGRRATAGTPALPANGETSRNVGRRH